MTPQLRRPGKPHLTFHVFDVTHPKTGVRKTIARWRCRWPSVEGVPFVRMGRTPGEAYADAREAAHKWEVGYDRWFRRPDVLQPGSAAWLRYMYPPPRPTVQIDSSPAHSWWRQLFGKV